MSKLPTISSDIPKDLRTFTDRIREIINVDLVKRADLLNTGVVTTNAAGNLIAPTTSTVSTVAQTLLPPPLPTGLAAAAAIQNVILTWDAPAYYGHAYTEVWGADSNNIGVAVLVGSAPGAIYTDPLGPNKTRYYWIRFVNGLDEKSAYNLSNGTSATTGTDVAYVLGILAGQITASELNNSLGSRINLIDVGATALTVKVGNLETTYGSTASAASSATAAAASAATATQAKVDAITAQGGAANSATTATTKASEAATSATNASGSASNASTYATTASTAATNAGNSATAAATSATNAATYATNSETSSTASNTAKVAAQSAQTAAGSSATAAATSASTATTKASDAATSATTASTAATTATTKAGDALTYSNNAATSANNAAGSATTAASEAGIATTAKNAAGVSATAAGVSQTAAANSATSASGSASSAATSLSNVRATIFGTSLGLPLEQWDLASQSIVTVSDGKVGNSVLRLSGGGGYPNQGNYVPIDPTKTYRTRFWARPSSGNTTGLLYFSLQQFVDNAGNTGPVNGGRSPYKPSGQNPTAHNATYGAGAWGEYSYTWTSADWQAGVKYVRPDFLNNYPSAAGYWEVQNFTFTDTTEISAQVQVEATARASQTGDLYAQYTVKLDVDGKVSGYGLASTGPTGAGSTFEVRADKFVIAAPAGSAAGYVPFSVLTAPTVIGGVTLPAGVYAQSAYILDGQITNAKIANLAVDNAKIADLSVAKLTAGNIATGQYIRSSNYVSGTSGFNIDASGAAQFNNVTVRGTVYASAGTFAGSLSAATGTFSGALSAATGSFAGSLSAATGSFSGDVTASTFATTPDATGTTQFRALNTGAVIADLVDIRRRTVLEYGTLDPTEVISGISSSSSAKEVTYYPAGTVFRGQIQQVVYTVNLPTDLSTYNSSGNQPYYVAAYFNGSIRSWTGSSGSTYDFFLRAHAMPVRTYSNSGAYSNNGRVSMIFDYAMVLTSGTFSSFRLPTATWIIYKL